MQEAPRPVPGPRPHLINGDQYGAFVPEQRELWRGSRIQPAERHDVWRDLLMPLLVKQGLVAAVRLAPAALWGQTQREACGGG